MVADMGEGRGAEFCGGKSDEGGERGLVKEGAHGVPHERSVDPVYKSSNLSLRGNTQSTSMNTVPPSTVAG